MQAVLRANPIEVQGWQTTNPSGVDLSFAGQIRYAGGTMAQFFSSFQAVPHAEADLIGTTGRMHLDMPWINKTSLASHVRIVRVSAGRSTGTFGDSAGRVEEETLTYENVNGYQHEVESMAACILDSAAPVFPVADSRGNIATLQALCAAARQGQAVKL